MLFQDEIAEDKGLFTFYREQADREEEIRKQKKLRKKQKQQEAGIQPSPSSLPSTQLPSASNFNPTKHYLPKTISTNREPHLNPNPNPNPTSKLKQNLPKQRLVEAIVDMGKDIDPQPGIPMGYLRQRDPSHFLKSRRYQLKLPEPEEQIEAVQTVGVEQMRIESLHQRNQSQELHPQKTNQAIHSVRASLELPDIRKPEEARVPYRPKKSLKSKLIQDALTSRDRDKIRQIRNYLKAHSPHHVEEEEEALGQERGLQVFEFRQQKLLGILKRFRKV